MLATRNLNRTGPAVGLFLLAGLCLLCESVLAGEEKSPSGEDSLVRVLVKQTFSGIVHNDKLIGQSTVVEISEFSGVVLDARGYVATYVGSHAPELENPEAIFVVEIKKGKRLPAELVGIDERISVAVLQARELANRNIVLGRSLKQEQVQIVGWNDSGWGRSSVQVLGLATGSGVPEARLKGRVNERALFAEEGSMVLDNAGRLLGFVTQSDRSGVSRGIGAYNVLPSLVVRDSVRTVVDQGKHIRAGWLGIILDASSERVKIDRVVEASPAAIAGLRPGDIISEVDGELIRSKQDFINTIRWHGPEARLSLSVERSGVNAKLYPELAEWPQERRPAVAWALEVPKLWNATKSPTDEKLKLYQIKLPSTLQLGLAVGALTPQLAQFFGLSCECGLLVESVLEGTLGYESGFLAGDILLDINGLELRSPSDLQKVMSAKDSVYEIKYVRDGKVSSRKVVLH